MFAERLLLASLYSVKVQLMSVGVSAYVLAAMDSAFMFTYAGGSFITGPLGDRFSPTAVVGIGLLGSTVCLALITFGSTAPAIATSASLSMLWFAGTQFLHGFFQVGQRLPNPFHGVQTRTLNSHALTMLSPVKRLSESESKG